MFELKLPKKLNNKKIKTGFKEDIEPQEVFLDSLAQKKEEELGVSEQKFEIPLPKKRFFIFFGILIILFLILFGKTFQLQVFDYEKFVALAERNKFIVYSIQATRGVIYDQHMNQLVFNQPSFDLVVSLKDLPSSDTERENILKEVSKVIKIDFEDLKDKIEESKDSEVLVAGNLDHQALIVLEARINRFPGFSIENNWVRNYKNGQTFSHLIGYTGKITTSEFRENPEKYSIFDWVGRTGIEKSYEEVLRKNPGRLRIERDAFGNLISQEIVSLPEPGNSLVLWLDSELQNKIEKEMERKISEIGAKGGVAVALDPKTGGVLSMVSLPSFDNNLFQKGSDPEDRQKVLEDPQKPLFNRAIAGKYLTGSTIKPLIALAALEEEIITPQKQIYSSGLIEVPHRYDPEIVYRFRDWEVHGWTDLRKAIAQSVNVYFYSIGGGYQDQKGLGPTKIKEYLELFNWNEKTGIDLPNEAKGFIPDVEWKRDVLGEGWWDGDTYHLSIGQGFLQITPLEVAVSIASIVNGGKILEPRVVKKIIDNQGNLIEKVDSRVIREDFVSYENLKIVKEGMRHAVTGENSPLASAVLLNSLPVSSGAKTGTAELGNDRYHNWVTIFAPYDDPEIVLTLMMEDIKGVQAAVLPVAKEVLEWYFSEK